MTSGNVSHLKQNPPTTRDELLFEPSMSDKVDGLHSFTLRGEHGDAAAMGGNVTPVYYIDDHEYEDVIRAFLEANPRLVESKTWRGLVSAIGSHGRSWRTAAREVLDEFYDDGPQSTNKEGFKDGTKKCTLCGESVSINTYPNHLASNCEGTN